MNSIEKQECEMHLGTSDGVTMEDYFNHMNEKTDINKTDLKNAFKDYYSDVTDWSF
tara:strand:- start:905 stop:1072 length:168 start_codon:yes stop_codon:yes gene_type:complete